MRIALMATCLADAIAPSVAPMALSTLISFFLSSTTMIKVATTVKAATRMMSASTALIPTFWMSSAVKRPRLSSFQSMYWYAGEPSASRTRASTSSEASISSIFASMPTIASSSSP